MNIPTAKAAAKEQSGCKTQFQVPARPTKPKAENLGALPRLPRRSHTRAPSTPQVSSVPLRTGQNKASPSATQSLEPASEKKAPRHSHLASERDPERQSADDNTPRAQAEQKIEGRLLEELSRALPQTSPTNASNLNSQAEKASPAQVMALIERIEVFVKSQRPALAITLNNSLGAQAEVERLGPKMIALRLTTQGAALTESATQKIRAELKARGLTAQIQIISRRG